MNDERVFSLPRLLLFSLLTFLAICVDFAPTGMLEQISEDLHISYANAGWIVGLNVVPSATGVAVFLSPKLAKVNRKKLLLVLLTAYTISNILVAVSPTFPILLAFRFIGGLFSACFWPMIGPYGARIVPLRYSARALAIVDAGTAAGTTIGIPFFTMIGQLFGWRSLFIALALSFAFMFLVILKWVPSVKGDKSSNPVGPKELIQKKSIRIVLVTVIVMIVAQYLIYIYIQALAKYIATPLLLTQTLFGLGGLLSVIFITKFVDDYLFQLVIGTFSLCATVMLAFFFMQGQGMVISPLIFLWGAGFGPFSALFMNVISEQTDKGKETAIAMSEMAYDIALSLTNVIGGILMGVGGIHFSLVVSFMMMTGNILFLFYNRHHLRFNTYKDKRIEV